MKKRSKKKPSSKFYHHQLYIPIILVLSFASLALLWIFSTGATGYATYSFGNTVPQGFGVPWNVFSSQHENIISSSNGMITAQADYVYKYGYVWDGSQWTRFEFPQQKVSNNWVAREASFDVNSLGLTAGEYSVVAYTCQYVNKEWKCGCRTSQCRNGVDGGMWQLQKVRVTGSSLGPNAEIPRNIELDVPHSQTIYRGDLYYLTINVWGVSSLEGIHYKVLYCDATVNPSCEPNVEGNNMILNSSNWRFFRGTTRGWNNFNATVARWSGDRTGGVNSLFGRTTPPEGEYRVRFVLNGIESQVYNFKVEDSRPDRSPSSADFTIYPAQMIEGQSVTLQIIATGIASRNGLEDAAIEINTCYAGSFSSDYEERDCFPVGGQNTQLLPPAGDDPWILSSDSLFSRATLLTRPSTIVRPREGGSYRPEEGYYNVWIKIYGTESHVSRIGVRSSP